MPRANGEAIVTKYRLSHVTALTLVWALGGCADMQGALMDLGEAGQGAAGSVTNAGGEPVAVETAPGASGSGMGGAAALPPGAPEAPTGEATAVPLQPGAGADAGTSSEEPDFNDPATAAPADAGSEAVAEPPEPDPVEPPVVAEPDPEEPPVVPPSFQADVWPIFIANCSTCHTTLRRGGHSVGSPVLATADADARRLGVTLIERLDGGGMPPRCSGSPGDVGCIAVADLAMIQLWIDTGMAP